MMILIESFVREHDRAARPEHTAHAKAERDVCAFSLRGCGAAQLTDALLQPEAGRTCLSRSVEVRGLLIGGATRYFKRRFQNDRPVPIG